MKQIVIVTPGSISKDDKETLKQNDIICIEHQNPHQVRIINIMDGFEGNDIFNCAITAINTTSTVEPCRIFGQEVIKVLAKKTKSTS